MLCSRPEILHARDFGINKEKNEGKCVISEQEEEEI
jgi:hypothetical protein